LVCTGAGFYFFNLLLFFFFFFFFLVFQDRVYVALAVLELSL
jgi:hypothetical protein